MREDFGVARGVIKFIEFIGWLAVAIGAGFAVLAASNGDLLAGGAVGAIVALAGLIQIAVAQLGRAQIATAENTGEMVGLLRDQARTAAGAKPPAAPAARPTAVPPAPARPAPVVGDGVGSVIKRYKGQVIVREPYGVSIDGVGLFKDVLTAERYIDANAKT